MRDQPARRRRALHKRAVLLLESQAANRERDPHPSDHPQVRRLLPEETDPTHARAQPHRRNY